MTQVRASVLDVGNCDHDHALIHQMLEARFGVSVDRVASIEEALDRMRERRYDLVLFNRIMDGDGREGIELVERAKADPSLRSVPLMMISNLSEAQDACVAAGGVRGFGKAALRQRATFELLACYLPGR